MTDEELESINADLEKEGFWRALVRHIHVRVDSSLHPALVDVAVCAIQQAAAVQLGVHSADKLFEPIVYDWSIVPIDTERTEQIPLVQFIGSLRLGPFVEFKYMEIFKDVSVQSH